jgi:hypothetical protein
MGMRKRLAAVAKAAFDVTGTYGDTGDRAKLVEYLAAPVSCDFKVYAYVYKIPLGNFYAHSEQAFDKASLWHEIELGSGGGPIPQPPRWGIASTLGDIALWIDDQ